MNKLRIGMASPWNTSSAIAQSTSEVAFELARRGHTITVLRTETGTAVDLPVRPAPSAIRHLDEYQDFQLRRDFDLIVCQFGNHFAFHGAVLPRLATIDVIGIIHDVCVPHLIRVWVNDDQSVLRDMVRTLYSGTPAAELPFHWDDFDHVAEHHPLVEWIAKRTIGAVAHAHHYADRLRSQCRGPTAVIPLAFDVPDLPPPPTPWNRTVIGVIGHANSNKRIDQLILAISASYLLRGRCRLRIIGEATETERARLTNLSRKLGTAVPEFTGWVSDEDLRWQLRDVDVISCLRNPVFEGASASLILGLMSGRPVLITNHGCYAEVPSDAALLCQPHSEAFDVLLNLEHIVRDPAFGLAIGKRGRAFARDRHTAAAYVDMLEPLLDSCMRAQPIQTAKRSFANTLAEFGLAPDDIALQRSVAALDGMTSEFV